MKQTPIFAKPMITRLILISFILFSFNTTAQDVGVFGTINNSKISGDSPKGFKINSKSSYEMGILLDLNIGDHVKMSISPGYFSAKSTAQVRDKSMMEPTFKDSLDIEVAYFMIPIMFKIDFTNSDRLYFIGGFEAGIKTKSTLTNLSEVPNPDPLPEPKFQEISFNLALGVGYRIPLKSSFFFVEMRYNQGLTDITERTTSSNPLSRMKLKGVEWNLGYALSLKKKDE